MQSDSPFASPDLRYSDKLRISLQPAVLLRSLLASATIWLLMASAMPSYASLIFHGKLAGYFAAGLGITLVSQIIIISITSIFCSDHTTLVIPQSPTAVIQGLIASSVAAAAPADMPPEALFPLVYWITALSALLTGGFLLLLGFARAGDLVRFIPYPIVGGFLAGLGWLIFNASFGVVVDLRLSAESLPMLLEGGVMARWLPSALFALCALVLQARVKSPLVMPCLILASLVLFYAWASLFVGDANALDEAGWRLPIVPDALNWQLLDFAAIGQLDLAMISASAGGILTLIVVHTLNVFFRAGAQELVIGREMDFNRECAVNGMANAVSGVAGGGIVGYHAPASSSLVEIMGVYGRLVGLFLALMFGLTLAFGSALFSLVPRFLPAGLLMFFGLQFMKDWLLESWFKLPRQDYLTVLIIALATALFGLLSGIAVGTVVAILLFLVEYSRIDVIKQELSGGVHRSNVDRSYAENQFLQVEGESILIMRLQGFVFFGTAYRFYEHIRSLIADEERGALAYLILDFKAVRGFDVSTINDFKKLKRLADRNDISLVISDLLPHLQQLLEVGGIIEADAHGSQLFDDLDHALEWCENTMLAGVCHLTAGDQVTVVQQLSQHAMIDSRDVDALAHYLERIETQVGDVVCRQGEASDSMYFIESGRVDVLLGGEGQEVLRLRSMTAGTVFGEVGFYLQQARGASIAVTEAGVLQKLSFEALQEMETADPRTASALHVFITCILSDRLTTSNRVVQELMD